ncbi:hypothetical protein MUK42_37618 [Musa troglodytarum]|uniref:Dof zinc finger protein n=1 Tax=Musa troglodytarum TaxID=320322 RepID=A0A9E7KPZ6_9LILI|nr:hypothetical protein MUK42_37618 [Musa troglodytarum]
MSAARHGLPPSAHARSKPHVELSPRCPRCASCDANFCYYNNYSLSQPRYFCKGCRRYWTVGGSLRNVPLGGRSRMNRTTGAPPVARERSCTHRPQSHGTEGSVELAASYATFSSRRPQLEPGLAVPGLPEDIDSVTGSTDANSGHPFPVDHAECQGSIAEPIGEGFLDQMNQQYLIGDLDPNNTFDTLPSPSEIANYYSSDLSNAPDFVSEANMYPSLDHNLPSSDWCSS